MQVNVEIVGLERLKKKYANLNLQIEKEVQATLFVSAKQIEGDAKKSILRGQKTGRLYQRRSVSHRASAPGEAPANDTGRLANSINAQVGRQANEAEVRAGGGIVRYARMLEFGTIRMAARPFMFPAVEKNKKWIQARMKKAIMDAIAKVKSNA